MVEIKYVGNASWNEFKRAVENVKNRSSGNGSLECCGVAYAVIGGNAVQHWVFSRRRICRTQHWRSRHYPKSYASYSFVIIALSRRGHLSASGWKFSMFLDGSHAKNRGVVHVVFAVEKVRAEYPEPVPLQR